MDISTVLNELFKAVLTVAIPIISAYLVGLIENKSKAVQSSTGSAIIKDLVASAEKIVTDAVTATNQTLVDGLKKDGKFDEAAAKQAFEQTKATILKILPEDTKNALATLYGDVDAWLTSKIESTVKTVKTVNVHAGNSATNVVADDKVIAEAAKAAGTSANTSETIPTATATEPK